MVISIDLISASTMTAEVVWLRWSISLCDMKRASPVSLRRRWARRSRIVGVLVSGRKNTITRKITDEAQMTSRRDHRHPMTGTEKPESRGPRLGPQYAAATHAVRA